MRIRIQKHNSHVQFWSLFALLMVLIFVRYVLQINFPWFVLLAVVAVMAFLGDRNEILALCLCCVPLYSSLQYIYAVMICMIFYVIKFRSEIRINSCLLVFLLMLAWEWLHCFDEHSSIVGAVRALVPLLLCVLLTGLPQDQSRYPFLIRALSICVIVMCMIMISKHLIRAGFNFARAFSNMKRLGLANPDVEVAGADLNPNFLGFLCVISGAGLLQLRFNKEHRRYDMLMLILLVGFGFLTMSRTYLFCLVLMIGLFVLVGGVNVKKLLKYSGIALSACLLILLLMLVLFPSTLEAWIERFLVEDITSGRLDLMKLYHYRIFDNPDIYSFGVGIQSVSAKVISRFGSRKILGTVVPHNAVQELIFCWGIPGALIFVVFICGLIRNARHKNHQTSFINYIPLLLLLVKIQAGQLIATPPNLLTLMVPYLSICHVFDVKKITIIPNREKETKTWKNMKNHISR